MTALAGGRPGLLSGLDVDPATGGLLSIAQLQAALRSGAVGAAQAPLRGGRRDRDGAAPAAVRTLGATPGPETAAPTAGEWLPGLGVGVLVVAAHPGAGASTVALAIAEAAAADGGVHLLEWAEPGGCGLAAVSHAELGVDASGRWRQGRRDGVLISRPTASVQAPPAGGRGQGVGLVVLDVGCRPDLAEAIGEPPAAPPVVVVCQASVPGVGRAEALLGRFGSAVAAVVGSARWPGVVRASRGPRLHALEETGRLVKVPADRRLAVLGLTTARLPRAVSAAATRIWELTRTTPAGPPGSAVAAVTGWMTPPVPAAGITNAGTPGPAPVHGGPAAAIRTGAAS